MKLTILLTGKSGQVGRELSQLLPRLGSVVAVDLQQMDLLKPSDIRRTIQRIRPQLIVNAAAYTSVDQAEGDEMAARAVNAEAPALMAEEAKKIGAALVHYSTDYVFDGSKHAPYEETDIPHPINVYGKTKLAGEQGIGNAGVPYLIFRTQWLYDTRGRNFLLSILRLATERAELKIVQDQIGAPAWSREIARATTGVLEQLLERGPDAFSHPGISGIYHMTARGETNWHEFAEAILDEASQIDQSVPWFAQATQGQPLRARRVIPIASREFPTPARRPAYSVLSNSRLEQTFGVQLPHWRMQLVSAFRSL
ncbi:MAG TPA: dTDP-4-dehydrorhamnose reductase [Verrucomicrobiae bacterium]|jgi:dTDP-4-dehydrorhamnose reductase|nr:dTDP-4-dehydrorhamnose reductase [Verrucomicrobiae bacterium]